MTAKKKTASKKIAKKAPAKKAKPAEAPVAKKPRGNRWRPMHRGAFGPMSGDTIKENVFLLWLKNPTGVDAVEIQKAPWCKDCSLSTVRKWLNGFSSGRDGTNDSNYPRCARDASVVKQIEKALKATGGKLDAAERKRLLG